MVTIDGEFVFEIMESVGNSTERHHIATVVVPIVYLVAPTSTCVVVSLFVLFDV